MNISFVAYFTLLLSFIQFFSSRLLICSRLKTAYSDNKKDTSKKKPKVPGNYLL